MAKSRINKKLSNWTLKRHLVHAFLFILFFLLPTPIPFIPGLENGLLSVDVPKGQIHFFTLPLVTGLFHLFFLGVILAYLVLATLAVVHGKIFCGWICPQNMFFEPFEGIHNWLKKRYPNYRKSEKAQKYVDMSMAFISATLMGWGATRYFHGGVPIYLGILFTIVFLFIFYDTHFLKHKFCQHACPYAVFQKAVQRRDTLHINWENRPGNKCGVCRACERACYVDLDIKKDTYHIDCTLCGACVDACDQVFRNKPEPSLLKYSFQDLEKPIRNQYIGLNSPVKIITAIIIVSFSLFVAGSIVFRPEAKATVLSASSEAVKVTDTFITNVYKTKIRNLMDEPQTFRLKVLTDGYTIVDHPDGLVVSAGNLEVVEKKFFLKHGVSGEREPIFGLIQFEIVRESDQKVINQEQLYFYTKK